MFPLKRNHFSFLKANYQTHKRLLAGDYRISWKLAGNRTEAKQQTCAERLSKCCESPLQQRDNVLSVCMFRYLQAPDLWVSEKSAGGSNLVRLDAEVFEKKGVCRLCANLEKICPIRAMGRGIE